jgi:hypothetical protein
MILYQLKNHFVMNETNCIFDTNKNPICLPTKVYEKLRIKVMNKFNLKNLPSLNEIKDLLLIDSNIQLENRIKEFLDEKVDEEFRVKVPNIYYHGLSGYNLIKIFDKLQKYYDYFHYRGPCLLDYNKSWMYDYSDFVKYPINYNNNKIYNIYYLLLLTIKSTDFKPGHWIGICIVENAIFYYDSLNGNIRPEFKNLLDLISIELKLQYPNILSWRNNKQVQTSGKHCGVFQIHFITTILELYKQKKLFNVSGNILKTKSINNELLSHYLQDDLSQSVIEKTIANYFYVNI